MTEMEQFNIPRNDWYDEDGRIYKDVIIENLDACESKLLEIGQLDAINVQRPNFDEIEYPDTTLESDPDCIINLKSFIDITGIVNYPIELSISGKLVKKISYWDSSYNYVTLVSKTPENMSESNPWVYVDTSDKTVKATNDINTANANVFIGKFDGTEIRAVNEKMTVNANLMYLLGNMTRQSGYNVGGNDGRFYNPANNSRMVGFTRKESKTGNKGFNYTDYGF